MDLQTPQQTIARFDQVKQEMVDLKPLLESLDLQLEQNQKEREQRQETQKKELIALLSEFSNKITKQHDVKLNELQESTRQQLTDFQQEYTQATSNLTQRIDVIEKKQAQQKAAFRSTFTLSASVISAGLLLWLWHYIHKT